MAADVHVLEAADVSLTEGVCEMLMQSMLILIARDPPQVEAERQGRKRDKGGVNADPSSDRGHCRCGCVTENVCADIASSLMVHSHGGRPRQWGKVLSTSIRLREEALRSAIGAFEVSIP